MYIVCSLMQKQPLIEVPRKRCSGNMQQIYRICQSVISTKFLCNVIEIRLWHWCSPVNLLHILRQPFLRNTPGGLLLIMVLTGGTYWWWNCLYINGIDWIVYLKQNWMVDNYLIDGYWNEIGYWSCYWYFDEQIIATVRKS